MFFQKENSKFLSRHNKRGFTLIEISLSIVIISLLAAFVLVAIDPAKKIGAAKDTRRLQEADSIKTAVYDYVLKNQSWPTEVAALATSTPYVIISPGYDPGFLSATICDNVLGNVTSSVALSLAPTYIPTIPFDPEGAYYYLIRNPKDVRVFPCSTYANSSDINEGLISLWHLDEGSWTTAASYIKDWENLQHGTVTNVTSASSTTDNIWGANGGTFNNGLITIAASATINPSNFSIGYWFKNRTTQPAGNGSVPRIISRTSNHFEVGIANSYGPADDKSLYTYYQGAWHDTTYDATPDEWHYYVWTYDGTVVKLYVDGVEEYSASGTVTISASDVLYIGNTSAGSEGVNGKIDEVSLWDRALSAAEAAFLFDSQR